MAKKKYTLDEEEILSRVEAKVRTCVQWPESKVGKEREKVIKYYEQKEPARQHAGNSSYVSSDVYDAVEMMKAQLLETFAGGHEIVRFDPVTIDDIIPAQLETRYIEEVLFSDNDGFGLMYDVFHDGLTARNAVASVYWEEDYDYERHEFEGSHQMDVEGLYAQDEVSDLLAEADDAPHPNGGPAYSGWYNRKTDKSKLCVEAIPPEEFYLEPSVKRREDGVRGRRTLKTKAELLAMGLDKKKVKEINWDDKTALQTAERIARDDSTDAGTTFGMEPTQDEMQQVLLHVTYIKLALKGDGTACLYRIIHANNVLFEIDEVDEDEYVDWAALRRPHTWWGNNFAHRVIPTQNARTVLTRGVLDHTAITTNPRWQVVQGALLNPREMLDNRLGGMVNVTRPDGVAPLMYPNLNPFVFQVMETLKANKEENTGISSLSQGLNKDAISKQNSQGLVGDLVALSQVRQKIIARGFAQWFLIPLYLKVHRTLAQNCKKPRPIPYQGQYVPVDPSKWKERTAISVSLHLGYGEQEKEAQKYVQLYQQLSADQGASPFFSPPKRYKLLTDAMRKNGFANYNDYLEPPEKAAPPPGPDPIDMKKAQAAETTAQAAMVTAQASQKKADTVAAADAARIDVDRQKTAGTLEKQRRDADRQDLDVANRIDVSQREIELAELVPPDKQVGVFSANS